MAMGWLAYTTFIGAPVAADQELGAPGVSVTPARPLPLSKFTPVRISPPDPGPGDPFLLRRIRDGVRCRLPTARAVPRSIRVMARNPILLDRSVSNEAELQDEDTVRRWATTAAMAYWGHLAQFSKP